MLGSIRESQVNPCVESVASRSCGLQVKTLLVIKNHSAWFELGRRIRHKWKAFLEGQTTGSGPQGATKQPRSRKLYHQQLHRKAGGLFYIIDAVWPRTRGFPSLGLSFFIFRLGAAAPDTIEGRSLLHYRAELGKPPMYLSSSIWMKNSVKAWITLKCQNFIFKRWKGIVYFRKDGLGPNSAAIPWPWSR